MVGWACWQAGRQAGRQGPSAWNLQCSMEPSVQRALVHHASSTPRLHLASLPASTRVSPVSPVSSLLQLFPSSSACPARFLRKAPTSFSTVSRCLRNAVSRALSDLHSWISSSSSSSSSRLYASLSRMLSTGLAAPRGGPCVRKAGGEAVSGRGEGGEAAPQEPAGSAAMLRAAMWHPKRACVQPTDAPEHGGARPASAAASAAACRRTLAASGGGRPAGCSGTALASCCNRWACCQAGIKCLEGGTSGVQALGGGTGLARDVPRRRAPGTAQTATWWFGLPLQRGRGSNSGWDSVTTLCAGGGAERPPRNRR